MKATTHINLLFTVINLLLYSIESVGKSSSEDKDLIKDLDKSVQVKNSPCDFDLSNIPSNSTVNINCLLDLKGETISLPENVNLDFEGGDITNGTLKFSGGNIDGRLLNSSLNVIGIVQLKDSIFKFLPSKWDIVQGVVNDETAKKNKDNFINLINKIKSLKGSTFSINIFDAFFKVDVPIIESTPEKAAITLPSDFKLLMTNNTHLRMQPNSYEKPVLLSVADNKRVTIEGGNLYGDRDEHDYSSGGTHEWGHLLMLKAAHNVTVKNVIFKDATGDAIDINGLKFSWEDGFNPSRDILITGNKLIRSRRNNLSITSAYNVIVENNEFIDAGIHTPLSQGTAPSFAIDIEADRSHDPPYEIVEDVIIRNNIEKGSRKGGFLIYSGDKVIMEDNQMENSLSFSSTIGSTIRNNTLTAMSDQSRNYGAALSAGVMRREDKNYNNAVYGNTITGFSTGIRITNTDLKVYDNKVIDCTVGIAVNAITNSKVYNNEIKSTRDESDGINSVLSKYVDELYIYNNTIDVIRKAIRFYGINTQVGEESFRFSLKKNKITSSSGSIIDNVNGIIYDENEIRKSGIRFVKSKNSTIRNNIITSTVSHGIEMVDKNYNLKISRNIIDVPSNFVCIKKSIYDTPNSVEIGKNLCK